MKRQVCLVLLAVLLLPLIGAHAMDVTEQRQFADGLFARGLYDLALNEYLPLSRLHEGVTDPDVILYRIGECHRRLKNWQAGDRFYLRVLTEYPESEYALHAAFRRAELQSTQGRYMDALSQFRALLEKPNLPPEIEAAARYYKGYAAKRLLLNEAEEDYRQIIADYPDSPFAQYAAIDLADLLKTRPEQTREMLALYQQVIDRASIPQITAEALFQTAEWHYAASEYSIAATTYDRLLTTYPDHPRATEAALQAAWAHYHASQFADGLTWANAALTNPTQAARRPDWLYMKANTLRQLMRADDARTTYEQLIQEYPDHKLAPVASYEIALVSFREHDFDRAVEEAKAITADPTVQRDVYWLLAESYAGLGREDEAVQYYRMLLDKYPDSEQAPRTWYRLGRLLQQRKDFIAAQRAYHELAQSYPDDPFASAALLASAYCAVMDQRYDDALIDWDALIKQYPNDPLTEEALYQKGLTQMQMDRPKPARTTLDSFLKKYPHSRFAAEAGYWRGILLEGQDRLADAIKSLRTALDAEPDIALSERIRYRLAMLLQRQGEEEEAADLIQSLLDTPARRNMPPSLLEWLVTHRLTQQQVQDATEAARIMTQHADTPAWKQIAWSLYGRALMASGATDDALAAFKTSLNEDAQTREGAEAALFLGDLALTQNDPDAATRYYERAAQAAAADALIDIRAKSYFGLGQAAEMNENWATASRYFLSVGLLFDDATLTPESLYRAVHALEKEGRPEESARTRNELLEQYPNSTWAAQMAPLEEEKEESKTL